MRARFLVPLLLALPLAPVRAETVTDQQADAIVTRAVESVAGGAVARIRPHRAFSGFLQRNGAAGLMQAARGRRDKAVLVLSGVMYESGCYKMAGAYFRHNYQFSALGHAEPAAARVGFDRLAGPASEWCVELGSDDWPAAPRCKKPSPAAKGKQARWDKLAAQAEQARARRNAYLSSIRFNRFDYVAAVTSPTLDLYDPAMQRPDNAACAILADDLSKALFSRLRHDAGDDAYYLKHRQAIDAAREVWRKMDGLEK
ncbi:hypothetical protein KIF53_17465 [Chromobacterium subtsugae]|uniref:Lipoprotein n=1 Tax=Chromobacterium subtsugae TaxID=251747 RepID=A0ABS7FI76_9NEIS|nr:MULTISPECIES: hypothetical protein [Chromobacterium]MBW7568744.1 hypothetical protein [Chromobacterium subtsugae]MBW8289426.1 hypothetical protein [Chromobacterium subtsugae]WSE90032.1 hypothetical protein U6115_14165 [Chromobacterium subtsugae]WVH58403.1 hypothetical protein U6151_14185 [Chromobacterium subtsugae]